MLVVSLGQQSGEDDIEASSCSGESQSLSELELAKSDSRLMMRDELLINVQKFSIQVSKTVKSFRIVIIGCKVYLC